MYNSEAVQIKLAERANSDPTLYFGSFEVSPIVRKHPGKDIYVANLGHYKEIAFTSN